MLDLLAKAFPQQMKNGWETQLKKIIPSYGQHINDSPALTNKIRRMTSETLSLPYLEVPDKSTTTFNATTLASLSFLATSVRETSRIMIWNLSNFLDHISNDLEYINYV